MYTGFLTHLVGEVQVNTERAIRHALQERLALVLVINKVIRGWTLVQGRAAICPQTGCLMRTIGRG